ncbi:hypothetical protein [Sorangium sp. So ce131]|uniref:hypothetical protein n=1 Tax=Sorangium sp. So ce131 TaxID=3133282 RepID=UPI003F63B83F
MSYQILKSLRLSALFLAGLLPMLSMTACVAPSDEAPCALGDGASEGDEGSDCELDEEEEESDGADEEAPSEQRAPRPSAPARAPQAMCSPICDPI